MKHHATNGYRELRASRDEALRMYRAEVAFHRETIDALNFVVRDRNELRKALAWATRGALAFLAAAVAGWACVALLAWRASA